MNIKSLLGKIFVNNLVDADGQRTDVRFFKVVSVDDENVRLVYELSSCAKKVSDIGGLNQLEIKPTDNIIGAFTSSLVDQSYIDGKELIYVVGMKCEVYDGLGISYAP